MLSNESWLPIAEYAMRTGISISTLRRKIKTDTLPYRMEEGRYLIRLDSAVNQDIKASGKFISVDMAPKPVTPPHSGANMDELRWRALEARVVGLAKKVDVLAEQLSEMKMLVKVFEEKLDGYR